MAPKAAKDRAKKKAAKQKKILIVLGLLLLVALFFAYTTLSQLNSPPKVSETPAAQTTPAGSIPDGSQAAAVEPGIIAAPVDPLNSFTSLGRKDPFHDSGPNPNASSSPKTTKPSNGGGGGGGGTTNTGGGGGGTTTQPPAPLTDAVISFNGTKLAVILGANFGHAPGLTGVSLFRLLSISQKSAVIGVIGTQQRFTLMRRQTLNLEQAGGWRYQIILEPINAPAPMTVAPAQTTTTTEGP